MIIYSYKVQECPKDSKENLFRVRELSPSLGADLISTGQGAGYLRLYPWLSDSAVGSDIEIFSTIEHSVYTPLVTKTDDYYNTNAIARASKTMSECSSVFVRKVNFTE